MITPNDFKNGMIISFEGRLYEILEFQHVKPGKGGAFVRTRLKDLKEDFVIDRTFRPHEMVEEIHVEEKKYQFLYQDGENFLFMDTETYEQISFESKQIKDKVRFLKEGMDVTVLFYTEKTDRAGKLIPFSIVLPTFVELKVIEAPPGLKGDTVSSPTKEVVLENGSRIQVPLFINAGETIRINTRTGEYVERA